RRALLGPRSRGDRDRGHVRGRAEGDTQGRSQSAQRQDRAGPRHRRAAPQGQLIPVPAAKQIGDVGLNADNISLSFVGERALTDISLAICDHEILAIIGPNGAGKTSMLNVINGFYHPQRGIVEFKGKRRNSMGPYFAAKEGIARTFQNVALFKGMTTLDNIMTGRALTARQGLLLQAIFYGPARR